jgi:integrase
VSEGDRKRLVLATVDAMKDAHAQLRRNAEGDYRPDPQATRFPPPRRLGPPLTVAALWADYKEQKQPSLGTIKRWEPILTKMAAFVGVADVRDLTEDDLIRWRDHLLQAGGLGPKTVRDVYIAAVSAVFRWGKGQGKLKANPAADIEVTVPAKPQLRDKGFTEVEARTILSASLAPPGHLITPEHAAARRWVPWLCPYTGARVNEITQLRGRDVIEGAMVRIKDGHAVEEPFHFFRITPKGSLPPERVSGRVD